MTSTTTTRVVARCMPKSAVPHSYSESSQSPASVLISNSNSPSSESPPAILALISPLLSSPAAGASIVGQA
ncbi:hypothetical protein L3X38_034977 [Prunus dulcis]|uniref:Uncharacterized protein n=1 Tax=Prunus dulcis TaxID=3755 RepID=A0AAD4VK65_PRUDU|nr:hypothetical protein L3X38_034977 [Prunus dulcis]